ncbi:MAG: SLBB domain-containing protein [Candidatus Thermoplasmatota archaeon]|nr:SLBB domain-containing protein [Candidatus Thermoplasmatota archaeon]
MTKRLILLIILFQVSLYAQSNAGIVSMDFGGVRAGYDITNTLNTPTQRASLAMTNPDYMVTPGDLYQLTFISTTGVQRLSVLVAWDYSVSLSNMGKLNGENKTYLELRHEILELVSRTYPLSAPELVIIEAGSFPVFINGEVKASGEVTTWSLIRLSELLQNRATDYASIRDIQITDRYGKIESYDIFTALRRGNLEQDPYLRPGDRILVKQAKTQVRLDGAVFRADTYQLLPGETLKDLIENYGEGFLDNADTTRISITRAVDGKGSVGENFEVSYEDAADFALSNMDRVSIRQLQSFLPVVFFEGAIYEMAKTGTTDIALTASQRISYSFYPGETLADAVRNLRDQFVQMSDLERAYLRRESEVISIDLSRYLYDHDFTENIELQPNDVIVIPFRQFFVTVSGAVPVPGRYPYVPDRSWRYYVNLAGGIDPLRNSYDLFKVYSQEDVVLDEVNNILPEAKIEVATNSFLFYFNQYAPVITTILSIVSTTLGIMAATGNL